MTTATRNITANVTMWREVGDGEAEVRRNEEEVEGDDAEHRGEERRPVAEAHRHERRRRAGRPSRRRRAACGRRRTTRRSPWRRPPRPRRRSRRVAVGGPAAGARRRGPPAAPSAPGDDVDVDLAALADDVVEERRLSDVAPARVRRLADDDLRDVALARVADGLDRRRPRRAASPARRRATRRAACSARARSRSRGGHAQRRRRLDVDADELRVQARRHPPRGADEARRVRARRDAHEDALAGVPRLLDAVRGLVAAHLARRRARPCGAARARAAR